jgi:glycosyltransferase involved in cell wall biosynthesis
MECVSVVIPTFNRFKFLLNTIQSIKSQTHNTIEIIVVNDCSTEKEYYEYNWKDDGVHIIHLDQNSKNIFGFACAGHVRNKGIEKSTGKYVAFCDDDDIWFPTKIELQLNAMKKTGCKMSSTDALFGRGVYDASRSYKKCNGEYHLDIIKEIYKRKSSDLLDSGFPEVWTRDFISIHNSIICSSVLIEKELLDTINNMKCVQNGYEDYDCWLRALEHTNSVYVQDSCVYYDGGHGYGQNY